MLWEKGDATEIKDTSLDPASRLLLNPHLQCNLLMYSLQIWSFTSLVSLHNQTSTSARTTELVQLEFCTVQDKYNATNMTYVINISFLVPS